ncbi:hypothetical protein SmJEL517_g05505 [Synchytrium microbalum]|uniref:Mitochondrial import inner membrane translocase subunit TIM23 n=1 Tax=Synchytrium microbalum TaxID=1806994 RepID=A0A507BZ65_9FUNG|nr:uncharacterized protein SmJEL517_g05505 [Synchytrium microbalum]TPX31084.1 hypothetical protein SmJEL517_g05505 [Synchytrium microbalum]
MSFNFFGFGGSSKKQETAPEPAATPIQHTNASTTSTLPPEETVQSMLSGMKFDPTTLHPVAGAQGGVDYMFIDDVPFGQKAPPHPTGSFGPLPMRTNSDKMLYGTGTAYLLGLSSGGAYGFFRGLRNPNATTMKLRVNSVLNSCTRYGPWAGNSLGVMSLMWSMIDSGLQEVRGVSDYYNHIGSAFVTGILFKSTAGIRPAAIMGTLLASIVGAYAVSEQVAENGVRLPTLGSVRPAANA